MLACRCHGAVRAVCGKGQAGFTLIELMVSLVILAIVIAGLARPLLGAFSTASQARSSQGAQANVLRTSDQMQGDLLATRSPDRNTSKQRGVDSLKRGLLIDPQGRAVSDDPSDMGRMFDIYDVLAATPTMLRLVVEEDDTHVGSECAQWDVANTAATGRVSVRRRFFWTRNCTGAARTDTMLVPDQAFVPSFLGETRAAVPPVLSYQLVCSPTAAFCNGRYGSAGPGCQGWSATSAPGVARNLIVGVTIDLRSVEQQAGEAAGARAKSEITLPSRESTDYRRALGCG